jgi:membrane protease YdiL (CAAX protease family)
MRRVVASRRAAIAALVVPALVLVAFTARSYQPFDGVAGGRRATSTTFLDGATTVMVVLGGLAGLAAVWALFHAFRERPQGRDSRAPYASLVVLLVVALTAVVASQDILRNEGSTGKPGAAGLAFPGRVVPEQPVPQPDPGRDPQIMWPLVIGIAVLIAAALAAAIIIERRRDRRGRRTPEQLQELGRALDEAIDDLRRDPDPRRAVIAAYARMEQALTLYGFPRRPSEAPYEYLSRVARDLEAEGPVASLTELFEVAKFSEHSVDETMRGRAIDALTAVRAEVRAEAT